MRQITYIDGIPAWTDRLPTEFMMLLWDHVQAFSHFLPQHDKTWAVFLALVDICQATDKRTVRFGPKCYEKTGASRKTVYRAVRKLEESGVISVTREPGKCMTITLSDLVPVRQKKRGCRPYSSTHRQSDGTRGPGPSPKPTAVLD